MNKNILYQKLRAIRKESRFQQQAISLLTNIPQSRLSKMERGWSEIYESDLTNIAKVYEAHNERVAASKIRALLKEFKGAA